VSASPAVLELFCGIGGCAAALPEGARVAGAVDISDKALAVYRRNFPAHPARVKLIDGLTAADLASHGADLWWLSPPCQPFTRRGLGRDVDDPRAAALLHLVGLLRDSEAVRPAALALENVPGFEQSRCHDALRETLDRAGYRVRETLLCPTDLGVPNRRRRFYLVAALGREPGPWGTPETSGWAGARLPDLVDRSLNGEDRDPPAELLVPLDVQRRYEDALHRVDPDDPAAVTSCFTAAYGRSPVRSGSYLRLSGQWEGRWGGRWTGRLRRFAPHEILRLLGFPPSFTLPHELPARAAWPLVGNSLSVPAVRAVLAALLPLLPQDSANIEST